MKIVTLFTDGKDAASSVTIEDLEAALHGFVPSSLRGVSLHKPGQQTWKDVGGLHSVKQELCKMLEWPTKVIS